VVVAKEHAVRFDRSQFPKFAQAAVCIVLVTLFSHVAWSQAARTIRIIFPFPAGTGPDTMVRILSEHVGRARGLTMVVENRPGAATLIGTEAAARAAPDGNTLLFTSNLFAVTPHLRKVNYDPITSFEPICLLTRSPLLIAVNAASPYHALSDLVNAVHARPAELTLAGVGPASPTQVAFEMLKRAADINMTFVSYPGMAPTISALLGEHVTSAILDYSTAAEHLKSGRLRALATPSKTRIEALPYMPTVAESGYKDVEMDLWFGSFAPAKTSKEILTQLADWITAAMQLPEVKEKFLTLGMYPVGICGTDFGSYLRKQYDEYGRIIREANIKTE
jgi:tripartite-type tricarboxylate transporter receptor subunit TctC